MITPAVESRLSLVPDVSAFLPLSTSRRTTEALLRLLAELFEVPSLRGVLAARLVQLPRNFLENFLRVRLLADDSVRLHSAGTFPESCSPTPSRPSCAR